MDLCGGGSPVDEIMAMAGKVPAGAPKVATPANSAVVHLIGPATDIAAQCHARGQGAPETR
jgi:hypothetical protein